MREIGIGHDVLGVFGKIAGLTIFVLLLSWAAAVSLTVWAVVHIVRHVAAAGAQPMAAADGTMTYASYRPLAPRKQIAAALLAAAAVGVVTFLGVHGYFPLLVLSGSALVLSFLGLRETPSDARHAWVMKFGGVALLLSGVWTLLCLFGLIFRIGL